MHGKWIFEKFEPFNGTYVLVECRRTK